MSTLISKISGYILDKKHLLDCFTLRIHDEWGEHPMQHRGHGTDRVDGDRYLTSLRRTSPRWPRASTSRGTTERGHATSAIAIGMVMAAKMVWSVMICATSGASPPICRAIT